MSIIALQGLRGGAGSTSIASGLGWALHLLGETVLVVDLSPNNMLRLHFNTPFTLTRGWARAELDQHSWLDSAMRYTQGLDFLPFGQLSLSELQQWPASTANLSTRWQDHLLKLKSEANYSWILLDIPVSYHPFEQDMLALADAQIGIVTPDINNHIRLHQQDLAQHQHLLINKFVSYSQLQQDLHRLWLHSLNNLIPLRIHQDEAVAEALAHKQPVAEYQSTCLAADELNTLANWCLINVSKASA